MPRAVVLATVGSAIAAGLALYKILSEPTATYTDNATNDTYVGCVHPKKYYVVRRIIDCSLASNENHPAHGENVKHLNAGYYKDLADDQPKVLEYGYTHYDGNQHETTSYEWFYIPNSDSVGIGISSEWYGQTWYYHFRDTGKEGKPVLPPPKLVLEGESLWLAEKKALGSDRERELAKLKAKITVAREEELAWEEKFA